MRVFLWVLLLTGFCLGASAPLFAQGTLTPPGAPAQTMKSLSQIDAHITQIGDKRIAISAAGTVINTPGSYYLTANITAAAGGNGIQVAADNVTIDLNGFAIIGQGTSGTPAGIAITETHSNLCVKNGTITGFNGDGIGGSGLVGIVSSSRFEHLTVTGNQADGINIKDDSDVLDCVVTKNEFEGINVGDGCRIMNCVASGATTGDGIQGGHHVAVESCTLAGNASDGVSVDFGGLIHNCVVRANGFDGIYCSGGSRILDNLVDVNHHNGIYTGAFPQDNASRIEGNTCTYNGLHGIFIAGSGVNLIVRNSCRGNGPNGAGGLSNNYNDLQNSTVNVFGRIIDMGTPGMIPDSYGPWSNISY